jgi:hypothetical protein
MNGDVIAEAVKAPAKTLLVISMTFPFVIIFIWSRLRG